MEAYNVWEIRRRELWDKIAVLTPEGFEKQIWTYVEDLIKEK